MIKNLGSWAVGAAGVGGAVLTESYTHLAWLAGLVVCSLLLIAVVAGLTAVRASDPLRRADALKVLQAVLPMFRRNASSTSTNATKREDTPDQSAR